MQKEDDFGHTATKNGFRGGGNGQLNCFTAAMLAVPRDHFRAADHPDMISSARMSVVTADSGSLFHPTGAYCGVVSRPQTSPRDYFTFARHPVGM